MSYKALVIDDDPEMLNAVDDVLASIKHDYDWAWCQEQARNWLKANEYSYILLDLEIPVRTRGSARRVQNSVNLLDEIRSTNDGVPVIIMAPSELYNPGMGVKMIKQGATDFVEKPFPSTGRTLDKAIKLAIAGKQTRPTPPRVLTPPKPKKAQPFKGGELVFYPDRAELCEVKILGDTGLGQMRRILEILKKTRANGKFIPYSGEQLAKRIRTRGGQNAVAGCIRGFRNTVIKALEEEAGLICGRQDVIQSGSHGYRLKEWITVREVDSDITVPRPRGHGTVSGVVNTPGGGVSGVVNDPDGVVNGVVDDPGGRVSGVVNDPDGVVNGTVNGRVERRREWILTALRKGRKLRVPAVTKGLKCSARTAQRDLDALKAQGKIRFEGSPKTGHYCLNSQPTTPTSV